LPDQTSAFSNMIKDHVVGLRREGVEDHERGELENHTAA
jgi:hypothetical protein